MSKTGLKVTVLITAWFSLGTPACASNNGVSGGDALSPQVAGRCPTEVLKMEDGRPNAADALLDPGPTWVRSKGIAIVDGPTTPGSVATPLEGKIWVSLKSPSLIRQGTNGPTPDQLSQPQLIEGTSADNQLKESGVAGGVYVSLVRISGSDFGVTHLISARNDGTLVATSVCDYDLITRPVADFYRASAQNSPTAAFDELLKNPQSDQAIQLRNAVAAKPQVSTTVRKWEDVLPDQRQVGPGFVDEKTLASFTSFGVIVTIPTSWLAKTNTVTPETPALCVKTNIGLGSCTALIPNAVHGISELHLSGYLKDEPGAALVIITGSDLKKGYRTIGSFDSGARSNGSVSINVDGPIQGPFQLSTGS